MIKKLPVSQLREGMYVHDLNTSWLKHPFAKSHFLIDSRATLAKIQALGISEVYVDTERGADLQEPAEPSCGAPAMPEWPPVVARGKAEAIRKSVSRAEELACAQQVRDSAIATTKRVMDDLRRGKRINAEQITPVVTGVVDSVFRNQDALLGLCRIRDRDQYTFEHSVGTAVLMVAFAKGLGVDKDTIHELATGTLLHDIGKIRTPDHILNKPGRLTDAEFAVIRDHVRHGADLLDAYGGFSTTTMQVTVEHHERIDGSGYPDGKTGGAISTYGKMAAIVDVYDAMTADRVYREGLPPTKVLQHMLGEAERSFDPLLMQRFIQCVGVYPVGSLVRLESGKLAVVIESGEDPIRPVVRVVYDINQKRHLSPRDIDLAQPEAAEVSERIIGAEDSRGWGIQMEAFVA